MDHRMTILSEIARRISADLDLQTTLDAVVAAAAELIPCVLAEVSLWDPESEMLTLLAIRCDPERTYPVGKSFPLGEGWQVVRTTLPEHALQSGLNTLTLHMSHATQPAAVLPGVTDERPLSLAVDWAEVSLH